MPMATEVVEWTCHVGGIAKSLQHVFVNEVARQAANCKSFRVFQVIGAKITLVGNSVTDTTRFSCLF